MKCSACKTGELVPSGCGCDNEKCTNHVRYWKALLEKKPADHAKPKKAPPPAVVPAPEPVKEVKKEVKPEPKKAPKTMD